MTRSIFTTGMLILVLTSLATITYGQFSTTSGGRALGMAGTSLALQDEYALFNNPGALDSERLSLILAYNTRYLALDINEAQVGLNLPIGSFNTGIGLSFYGDEIYNQLEVVSAVSHQVGFAQLGGRLAYHQYFLENYGYKRSFMIDIGGVFTLSEQLQLAMLITNLTRAQLENQESYRLSSLLALAISYEPIDDFRVDMQLTKNIELPLSGSLGLEYLINDYVSARTGFNFTNSVAALGLGFQWNSLKLDIAGNYQPQLGYGAVLSLLITRKKDA